MPNQHRRAIDVLMLVEHVDRELDAMARIAERLERVHGLQADIRNYYSDLLLNLDRYQPRVLVTPFFYESATEPGASYVEAWPNAAHVNMAWEQILYNVNKQIKIPRDAFATDRVTHICWTNEYRDRLLSLGVPSPNAVLAGNPVMQFYRDDAARRYFPSRETLATQHGLDPSRKWVLFPENYRWAFVKRGQKNLFVEGGASLEWVEQAQQYCRESLDVLASALAALGRDDDPVFILRPRPATGLAQFADALKRRNPDALAGIHLIKEESAREWILAADHVISSYSTTLIEAALAGKAINVFSPVPMPEALADEWYGEVDLLGTGEALLEAIRAPARPESAGRLASWASAQLLPSGDPYAIIADTIHDAWLRAGDAGERSTADRNRLTWSRRLVEDFRIRLQRSGTAYHKRMRQRHPNYSFTLRKHEKDLFAAQEVARRVAKWQRVTSTE